MRFGVRTNGGVSALADLLSLFAGRVGGILVTLFFIPQYNRLLGPDVFGSVAIVLSLQAFFLVSDLGLATLISRDTAIARGDPGALTKVVWMRRRAEAILILVALAAAIPAVLLPLAGVPVGWSIQSGMNTAMISVLIMALVATNIIQLSLNALALYQAGAGISIAGGLVRGMLTVVVLCHSPDLPAFLQAQVVIAVLHFAAARWFLERRCGTPVFHERLFDRTALLALLQRCVPLTIYTLAAAAAVNLDKSIISAFISLEIAGAYFLATTYALVPVAILSGPINSYFAPRVANVHHLGDKPREYRLAMTFQLILMCAVIGPSLGLIFQMPDWLRLWLHDDMQASRIMMVAPILLAGGTLSATGYYPTTWLIAAGDNQFLARLSLICGVGVIGATLFFATSGHLVGIAWSYFIFYAAGFAGLWFRLGQTDGWRRLAGFLARAYAVPVVAATLGYFLAYTALRPIDIEPIRLIGPVSASMALSALASFLVYRSARSRKEQA